MSQPKIVIRKHLNADSLFHQIHTECEKIPDLCDSEVEISVADALTSGFAMFSLKDPSLSAFDQRRTDIFRQVQRGNVLEKLVFLDNCYLLSLDGTQYFSSQKIHCDSCLKKTHANTGEVTYSHQMLGAAIVHPDCRAVIPVCPEPIQKQDGETKNDCERNAAKRFLEQFRRVHPHLGVIVTEDGLSSNAPHIRELVRHNMHFILGAKSGDHEWLFQQVDVAAQAGTTMEFCVQKDEVTHRFRCLNEVALNESNQDVIVNFLEYWEIRADGTSQHFSWVTDITITRENAFQLMRGGRARWKIKGITSNIILGTARTTSPWSLRCS